MSCKQYSDSYHSKRAQAHVANEAASAASFKRSSRYEDLWHVTAHCNTLRSPNNLHDIHAQIAYLPGARASDAMACFQEAADGVLGKGFVSSILQNTRHVGVNHSPDGHVALRITGNGPSPTEANVILTIPGVGGNLNDIAEQLGFAHRLVGDSEKAQAWRDSHYKALAPAAHIDERAVVLPPAPVPADCPTCVRPPGPAPWPQPYPYPMYHHASKSHHKKGKKH